MPRPLRTTLHVWQVPAGNVPAALWRMGVDRLRLRGLPGVRFAKLLGTGSPDTFAVRDADLRRWALLVTVDDGDRAPSAVLRAWQRIASEHLRVELEPLDVRGRWSGQQPFGEPRPARHDGPVAVLTRARLRPLRAATFWRAVPPVAADVRTAPGLRFALPIGEAPVAFQGTFSVWDSASAVREFAYSGAHADVVTRTPQVRWYAEDLFARFAVVDSAGTIDGRSPLS